MPEGGELLARTAVTVTESIRTATLAVTALTTASGVAGDPTNHHYFANDGRTILLISNTGASTRTITYQIPTTVDGIAVTHGGVTVAAGTQIVIGPFPPSIYNQPSDPGNMYFNLSASSTDLKIQAFHVGAV
jgi:hypothetical protein